MTANPDYVAYAHPNLNVDNAWWWADPDSKQLDCGVLDWGGFKSRPVAMHLQLSLFAGGCDLLDAHGDGLLATFVDECAKEGGPELCLEELKLQVRLSPSVLKEAWRDTCAVSWDKLAGDCAL